MRRSRRTPLFLVLLAPALAWAAELSDADYEAALERLVGERHWYGIYLQGQKSGYALMETREADADGKRAIEFKLRARVKITTLGQKQDLRIDESRVFLRAGPLHRITTRFWTEASDVEVAAVVRGDKLLLTSTVGALTNRKELPAPTESLRDAIAADRLARPDAKIGDRVTIRQFEPTMQKEFDGVLTLRERKEITFNGVPTRVGVIEMALPAMGLRSTLFVDERGTALELTLAQMFTLRLEPEKQAKDIRYSSDLIRMGCVRLDPHPKNVPSIQAIRFHFTGIDDPKLLIDDARQKWTKHADGGHVVASKLPAFEPKQAATLPVDAAKFADALAPGLFVQSDDERVVTLAKEIVGDERNAFQAARKINRWLYEHIRKVGTAALSNAVETLESRQGDCTEHTVLFVALARAAGIPAREVAGVTAIEGGEGLYYHAWPEVWVGRWLAMDPTLGEDVADATHIKFAEGGADQLFRIVALFGRIQAKVLPADQPAD
jgi:hypothetical protein